MASAGLLRILTTGLQDERLSYKIQPSTFQKAFVRAGRFTTEWYRVDFDNQPAFGSIAKATLPRRGHLITRAFLVTTMPDISTPQAQARAYATRNGLEFAGPTFGWTNSIGHALINSAEVTIGANAIDTLDGRLMEVLDEFHTPLEKVTVVNRMLGRHDNGFSARSNGFDKVQEVITPLPFWFCRGDPSSALPIDAIGNDKVQINIGFNPVNTLYTTTSAHGISNFVVQNNINSSGTSATTNPSSIGRTLINQASLLSSCGLGLPPISNSPFYYLDPSGSQVFGLNGNPETSINASQIPGISMPSSLLLQDAHLLLEYVYIDRPEANRIRLADISYPIVQHYSFTQQTNGHPSANVKMRIPNPCKEIYFMAHRTDADLLNAPFLATRDLTGPQTSDVDAVAPWWPDAQGLSTEVFTTLVPAYSSTDSEPVQTMSLMYEGKMIRYSTDSPAFFRSILPSLEQRKTPWHNKYYYHMPFGTNLEAFGISTPMGHANLDKILKIDLSLTFKPFRGSNRITDVPAYTIYVWAETYNILRVYGGRAGLLFGY